MAFPLPSGEMLERFRRDLAAAGIAEGPLAIAVSGGGDSLALLLLAAAASPGAVRAATVDHGLRPEAAGEAASVGEVCATIGVPHRILSAEVDRHGVGLQAAARAARYRALAAWMETEGLALLLTAHHADDQAETLLMRLQRGSGVGGLAGVRALGPLPGSEGRLRVARPLLGWRRAELAAVVGTAGLRPVADPSNEDPAFDRVRMRQRLAEAEWLDVPAIARSAAALAEADEALELTASRLFAGRVSETRPFELDPAGLPAELLRRLVLRCLAAAAPNVAPRGEQVSDLIATLGRGETATLAGVKCNGGSVWRFEPAPPRRHG